MCLLRQRALRFRIQNVDRVNCSCMNTFVMRTKRQAKSGQSLYLCFQSDHGIFYRNSIEHHCTSKETTQSSQLHQLLKLCI
jgi:hypothetical protein